MKLADLFLTARHLKRKTLRDLEDETGLTNAYISQLETGKVKSPGWFVVLKLAKALEIDIELLLKCEPEE